MSEPIRIIKSTVDTAGLILSSTLVSVTFLGLVALELNYLAPYAFFGALAAILVTAMIYAPVGLVLFYIYRSRKNLRLEIYADRIERHSKVFNANLKSVELSMIQTVEAQNAMLGQKYYGKIIITGSDGSRLVASPIPSHQKVADFIRSL